MASLVGASVAGLKLLSPFGETRASELYLGECDDGRCMVKVVRAELLADRERVERALEAARTTGELDHRGIEFVIEAGWDGDHAYVLGDIVPGTNATRLIARRSLEVEQAAGIVRLAADALAAAHAVGVVHHGLEPLLVHVGFATDRVILRDFGLATLARENDHALGYRAPEQLAGDGSGAGPAADIYALGCIAAELVPTPTAREARDVVEQVAALIARMRASDPAARPTAAQARDELGEILRDAANVALELTAIATRRKAPTEPPFAAVQDPELGDRLGEIEAVVHAEPAPPKASIEIAPEAAPMPRLVRPGAWLCARCHTQNLKRHAFCLHCSAPASRASSYAHHDVSSLMTALAAHGSDELTPPPGPPPEPPGGDDDRESN